MKNIILMLIGISTLLSCKKEFNDYAKNPNDPAHASAATLLSGAQVATFSSYTGQIARVTNMYTQHIAGTDEQFSDLARYSLNEQTFQNDWLTLYTGALNNLHALINQYGTESPYYAGIGKVLIAMNLGLATDLWGDVPYSEAFKGLENNLAPKYDSQEQIFTTIQQLLDEAIVHLSQPDNVNKNIPSTDDLIFGGATAKWIKSAYILKARYYNRLSGRDASSATKAINALNTAALVGNSDDMNAVFFATSASNYNQWAAFMSNRPSYIRMGQYFIGQLTSTNDPRLPFFATTDDTGTSYSGNSSDDQGTQSTSKPGSGVASNGSSLPLVTYCEAKFIEAEAQFRLSQFVLAADAYNAAVQASLLRVTGAVSPGFASETSGTITLEKIIKQKYIALFTQIEPYNDYRRTTFPTLTPNPNGAVTQIPVRFPTSLDERIYNPNATVVTNPATPVWWDQP